MSPKSPKKKAVRRPLLPSMGGPLKAPDKFPVLISYWKFLETRHDPEKMIRDNPDLSFLLDSGAFSAHNIGEPIDLDQYMAFCHKYGHLFWGYAALDVINDPGQTYENFRIMKKNGLHPFAVHTNGNTQNDMIEMHQRSPLVMIGALVGCKNLPSILKQKTAWAEGRPVHWFGCTRERYMRPFQPWSSDSSLWQTGLRWGVIDFYLGRGRFFRLHRSDCVHGKIGNLPRELEREIVSAGFGIQDLRTETFWRGWETSGTATLTLCIKSWIRYSLEYREMFGTILFPALSSTNSPDVFTFNNLAGKFLRKK